MTRDQKVRKYSLYQIYFYLSNVCNLRCRHCWIAPNHQDRSDSHHFLSLELFRSIIKQGRPLGLSGVKLTGGEPLLHPQLNEIVADIRANDLELNVETNGTLCTKGLAREIAACKKPFVSVSLDGVDAETHEWMRGVSGSFDGAIKGIQNFVKAGIRPQIIMTMVRRNKDQIEPMVRLAESLEAGSVKFNILHPISRGEQMHKAGDALTIEELLELGMRVENSLSASTGLPLFFGYPSAFRPLGKIFGDSGGGGVCGILGILGVLANGSYALCGIGASVPELVFGHSARDRLEDIWGNAPILCQLREGLPARLEGICKECMMKNRCFGSCIAQNYYHSKSLWAPFWFCEEANRLGIFPATRLRPV
jgi:SynChlorMet cassette radical SAM/SPASM protein ScmF